MKTNATASEVAEAVEAAAGTASKETAPTCSVSVGRSQSMPNVLANGHIELLCLDEEEGGGEEDMQTNRHHLLLNAAAHPSPEEDSLSASSPLDRPVSVASALLWTSASAVTDVLVPCFVPDASWLLAWLWAAAAVASPMAAAALRCASSTSLLAVMAACHVATLAFVAAHLRPDAHLLAPSYAFFAVFLAAAETAHTRWTLTPSTSARPPRPSASRSGAFVTSRRCAPLVLAAIILCLSLWAASVAPEQRISPGKWDGAAAATEAGSPSLFVMSRPNSPTNSSRLVAALSRGDSVQSGGGGPGQRFWATLVTALLIVCAAGAVLSVLVVFAAASSSSTSASGSEVTKGEIEVGSLSRVKAALCSDQGDVVLVMPMLAFLGMQAAFMQNYFLKACVLSELGLLHLGPVILVSGAAGWLSARLTSAAIDAGLRRMHLQGLCLLFESCLLLLMLVWTPKSNDVGVFYAVAFAWGATAQAADCLATSLLDDAVFSTPSSSPWLSSSAACAHRFLGCASVLSIPAAGPARVASVCAALAVAAVPSVLLAGVCDRRRRQQDQRDDLRSTLTCTHA